MASRKLSDLHPHLADAFTKAKEVWATMYPDAPIPIISCTYRSKEEQNSLYAQGRTKKGAKVTNAKGGQSPHNYLPALAFDVAFDNKGKTDWSEKWFRQFAPLVLDAAGITWGGHFKSFTDLPHFEMKNWRALSKGA